MGISRAKGLGSSIPKGPVKGNFIVNLKFR